MPLGGPEVGILTAPARADSIKQGTQVRTNWHGARQLRTVTNAWVANHQGPTSLLLVQGRLRVAGVARVRNTWDRCAPLLLLHRAVRTPTPYAQHPRVRHPHARHPTCRAVPTPTSRAQHLQARHLHTQGYASALMGNTLMCSHFAHRGERSAVNVQLIGIASNMLVLAQVWACVCACVCAEVHVCACVCVCVC